MFEQTLTNDSYNFLCLLYKEYLSRCEKHTKEYAKDFNELPKSLLAYFSDSDCESCLDELEENEFVITNISGGFVIQNSAIILMENRFKKNMSELLHIIDLIKPF